MRSTWVFWACWFKSFAFCSTSVFSTRYCDNGELDDGEAADTSWVVVVDVGEFVLHFLESKVDPLVNYPKNLEAAFTERVAWAFVSLDVAEQS